MNHLALAIKEAATRYAKGEGKSPFDLFSLAQVEEACFHLGREKLSKEGSYSAREAAGDDVFSNLLKNTANKTMVKAYEFASGNWKKIVTIGSRPDFKENTLIKMEELARLPKLGKREPLKIDSSGERGSTYKVETYEKGYELTRQDIINDDLNGFMKLPKSQGRAAARTIDKFVWDLVQDNGTVGIDNRALFSGGSNLITTAPFNTSNLERAWGLMTAQTEEKSTDIIGLTPAYIACPPVLELLVDRVIGSDNLQGTSNNDMNPFKKLERITVPWLTNTTAASTADWYLIASPAQIETIQIDFLKGMQTPQTLQRNENSRDGYDFENRTRAFKTRIEFGGEVVDYRGFVKGDAV